MNVAVEPLRWWDIEQLAGLELVLFGEDSPWTAEMFWAEMALGYHYVSVKEGDQVVGYAGLAVISDEALVQTIGVRPDRQGRGIGRELLRDLISAAGGRRILLEVRVDNDPAISLYAAEGFERIGVRRGYYQPSGADAFVMQRAATLEVLA